MTDLSMDKIVDKVTISLSIDDLRCPITHEIMNEPYTATDGHIYERQAIEDWLLNHGTSPVTREIISIFRINKTSFGYGY